MGEGEDSFPFFFCCSLLSITTTVSSTEVAGVGVAMAALATCRSLTNCSLTRSLLFIKSVTAISESRY